jgi:hypothetical protein
MRETIRPVTLSRVVEVVDFCHQSAPTPERIKDALGMSENRTNEILSELERLSLIEREGEIRLTDVGSRFHDAVQQAEWETLHEILYQASPHYQVFIDVLRDHDDQRTGLSEEGLLDALEGREPEIRFNKTGVSLLTDWGERLQALQRNVFEDRYYCVTSSIDSETFADALQRQYDDMEVTRGLGMRQRYIPIPKLREYVCERLNLRRDDFDNHLVSLAQANIGRMELSGAPHDTTAKESQLGIKTIALTEEGGIVSTSMSSERVLKGITMPDGKMYYYITVFEELMDGEHDE